MTPATASAATVSPPPATHSSLPAFVSSPRLPRQRHRAGLEGRRLEGAQRPVPDQGPAVGKPALRARRRSPGPHRGSCWSAGTGSIATVSVARPASARGHHRIQRQDDLDAAALRLGQDVARRLGHVALGERFADGIPWARRKVLAMPPPMASRSTLASRLPRRASLVETLAPPTMAASGRFGSASAAPDAPAPPASAVPPPRAADGRWPRSRHGPDGRRRRRR